MIKVPFSVKYGSFSYSTHLTFTLNLSELVNCEKIEEFKNSFACDETLEEMCSLENHLNNLKKGAVIKALNFVALSGSWIIRKSKINKKAGSSPNFSISLIKVSMLIFYCVFYTICLITKHDYLIINYFQSK